MSDDRITRIGSCVLPEGRGDDVSGYWRPATCAEWSEAVAAAGGLDALSVWSGLTDLTGRFGEPFIFTCWGTDDLPVVADGGSPEQARTWNPPKSCELTHAVFVALIEVT